MYLYIKEVSYLYKAMHLGSYMHIMLIVDIGAVIKPESSMCSVASKWGLRQLGR